MEDILKQLKKLPFVDGIYLFGSRAKGTAKPYSDTDICVFAETTKKQRMDILKLNDKDVDVVLFNELPLSMQAAVFRDGKALYVRKPNQLRDAKYFTIKRYLDFQHILNNHIKVILG